MQEKLRDEMARIVAEAQRRRVALSESAPVDLNDFALPDEVVSSAELAQRAIAYRRAEAAGQIHYFAK